jgi:hypothetical protein
MHDEGKKKTKDQGGKRPLYARKNRATAISIGRWSSRQLSPMGRGGMSYKTLKKTLELEFVKRANGMPSRFRKIRKWTLWRGRPPPNKKRDRARSRNQICGSTGHSKSYGPPWEREKRRKSLDDGSTPGLAGSINRDLRKYYAYS